MRKLSSVSCKIDCMQLMETPRKALLLRSPHVLKSLGNTLCSDPLQLRSSWDHGAALAPPPLLDLGWERRGGGTCEFPSDFTQTESPAPLEMGCENQHAGGRAGRGLSWSLGY